MPDGGGGGEAVHSWHLAIHQNEIEPILCDGLKGKAPILDRVHGVPQDVHPPGGHLPVNRRVFD